MAFSGHPPAPTPVQDDQKESLSHHPYWEEVIEDLNKVIQVWEKVMKPVRSLQEFYKEDAHNPATDVWEGRRAQGDKCCLCCFFLRHLAKHDLAPQ